MVVGVASVAGAKTAEMFFLDRRTIAELGQIRDRLQWHYWTGCEVRQKLITEINFSTCAFIRQIKVDSVTISTPRNNITSAKSKIKIL